MFIDNEKKEKHCGFCGDTHSNECNPSSFNFYKCKCGMTQFMPWDAVAFGGGLQGIICGCNGKAEECWESIDYKKYTKIEKFKTAVENAKKTLKKGDKIRVSRCGGIVATYTFEGWDGNWIVSKSGIDDLSASSIEKLNGAPIDFTTKISEPMMKYQFNKSSLI